MRDRLQALLHVLLTRVPLTARVWSLLWAQVVFLKEKPLRLAVVAGAAGLGLLAGIPPGNAAYEYSWKDYRFCDDCHIHDYANEAYARSVHFGLTTCHDCHRVAIHHYPINLYLTVMYGAIPPEEMHPPAVETIVCTQCHSYVGGDEPLTGPMDESVRKRVVKIDNSPLHVTHLQSKTREPGTFRGGAEHDEDGGHGDGHGDGGHGEGEGGLLATHGGLDNKEGHGHLPEWAGEVITCMDCHGSESNRAHTFGASRDNCAQCHNEIHLGGKRLEKISCQECHFWGFAGSPDGMAAAEAPAHGEAPAEKAHH